MSDKGRGIYRKFEIKRTDGSSEPGGKHEQCAYFVLDLEHDEFAIPALEAYASAADKTHPALARDIRAVIAAHRKYEDARCNCREVSCAHSLRQTFTMTASEKMFDLMDEDALQTRAIARLKGRVR
jgi:hypothetical protein